MTPFLLADIFVDAARTRIRLGILQEVRSSARQRHYADAQVSLSGPRPELKFGLTTETK